ncbi:MAG TPA: molybdopterin-guanine dinucleotide biosynthesis protein B [Stellaceae bacterium]|nr:molybdopterin-guanine dinucleotide biosynthesis protein B [Stellaceae bacterium]
MTRIFGLAGWSGAGKTTLMVRLLPELTRRGLTVSTLKHAHHAFDVDQPGKDSFEHRRAGAEEVMIASQQRWALMREHRGRSEPRLEELLSRMAPVDLILIEGFKREAHPKLEVHRPALGMSLLCHEDKNILAVASDASLSGLELPVLALDDVTRIADFILMKSGLALIPHGANQR